MRFVSHGALRQRPSGHRRPGHPIPAAPKRRGSRIRGSAVRARQVTRPGAKPLVERTRVHARGSAHPRCQSIENRASSGDKTARSAASQRSPLFPRRSASRAVGAVRLGTPGSLSPRRRNALVRAFPSHHDLGSSASGSERTAASWHLGLRIADRETLKDRLFVGARHFRAGFLVELGFGLRLAASTSQRRAPRGAETPRFATSPFGEVDWGPPFRGAETPWARFALSASPPTSDRFCRRPQRQRCIGVQLRR
jgi:hypothetical protein